MTIEYLHLVFPSPSPSSSYGEGNVATGMGRDCKMKCVKKTECRSIATNAERGKKHYFTVSGPR